MSVDIAAVIGESTRYNLHTHTPFCDGKSTMEEMVAAAVAAGFHTLGFTPHSPIPIDSPCNMRREDVEPYLAEIARLRLKYGRHIRLLAGMEIDFLGSGWGPATDYFETLGLDYAIGSVHFVPDFEGEPVDVDGRPQSFAEKMAERFRGDIDYVVDTFFAQSLAMVRAGGFDILGHMDKIGRNASAYAPGIEDGSHYRSRLRELIEAVKQMHPAVELNTKIFNEESRFFPGASTLPELKASGIVIPVNSDAHRSDRLTAGREAAFTLLNS